MTKVWRNNNLRSDGNNQSDLWTPNSNSNSRAESDLNNEKDLRNEINMVVGNVTDIRNEESSEKQDDSSNVKMSNKYNRRKHKQWGRR